MIKKLTESNREECLKFVKTKPAENLFLIGDIEAFGFDSDVQELWGDFSDDGQLRAVLLRYQDNYIVYAPKEFDIDSIAEIIDADSRPNKMLSGISSIVEQVVEKLSRKPVETRNLFYAKCEELRQLDVPNIEIELVQLNDIPRLVEHQKQIFDTRAERAESIKRNMEIGAERGYFIADGDRIVSSAMTSAENSVSAMVVAVGTLPGYEKRGYASAIMTRLCQDLLREGKFLCLFYDNPAAGTIYKRIGFVDIGMWDMNKF